jgi:hypothetical protein
MSEVTKLSLIGITFPDELLTNVRTGNKRTDFSRYNVTLFTVLVDDSPSADLNETCNGKITNMRAQYNKSKSIYICYWLLMH